MDNLNERLTTHPNWVWCEGMRVINKVDRTSRRLDCNHLGPMPEWEVDLEDPFTLGHLWNLSWAYIQGVFHLDMMASNDFREDPFYVWVHATESRGIQCGEHRQGASLVALLAELLVWVWEKGPHALEEAIRKAEAKEASPSVLATRRGRENSRVKVVPPTPPAPVLPTEILPPTQAPAPVPVQEPEKVMLAQTPPVPTPRKSYRLVIKPRVPPPEINPQSIDDLFNLGDPK